MQESKKCHGRAQTRPSTAGDILPAGRHRVRYSVNEHRACWLNGSSLHGVAIQEPAVVHTRRPGVPLAPVHCAGALGLHATQAFEVPKHTGVTMGQLVAAPGVPSASQVWYWVEEMQVWASGTHEPQ